MSSNVIDLLVGFLLVVGCVVIGIILYWVYQDTNKEENKNKSSMEEKEINDDQKFTKTFKNDEDNVIKRR